MQMDNGEQSGTASISPPAGDDDDSSVIMPCDEQTAVAVSATLTATTTTTTKPAIRHAEKRRISTCLFADRVARVSIDAYRRHILGRADDTDDAPSTTTIEPTCLATIVACLSRDSNDKQDELFVVGLGVGTKFLSEALLQQEHTEQAAYGHRVRDCHAEVLARRAFRRFLSMELLKELKTNDQCATKYDADAVPSILERVVEPDSSSASLIDSQPDLPQYRLRPNITLQFYSSSCPCGNATIKRFATLQKECFRQDLPANAWPIEPHSPILPAHSAHLGQVALLIKKDQNDSRSLKEDTDMSCPGNKDDCREENPLKKSRLAHTNDDAEPAAASRLSSREAKWAAHTSTDWCPPGTTTVWSNQGSIHTCSDKLARWNVLGLQGSLLASFLKSSPLYMATLTVGRKFSAVTCRRAVCCRIAKDESHSAATATTSKHMANGDTQAFTAHHPAVMGTGVYLNEGAVQSSSHSIGQDVRFHLTTCYAWWPGISMAECIDGSTGYVMTSTSSDEHVNRKQRSLISTSALTELFLEIEQHALRPCEKPAAAMTQSSVSLSLADLRRLKQRASSDYEQNKTQLLTKHPTFKLWTRRCP